MKLIAYLLITLSVIAGSLASSTAYLVRLDGTSAATLSTLRLGSPAGTYDPDRPGTFHADHAVVQFFEARGWEWGGRWESPWDLHHFQKP